MLFLQQFGAFTGVGAVFTAENHQCGIFSSLSLSHIGLAVSPLRLREFLILAFLVRFEIAADHAAVADSDIFVRDQAMIERVRLQEFAGIFQGGFLFRHLLVDARLYRFVPADLRFGLQRQQRAGAKNDHV